MLLKVAFVLIIFGHGTNTILEPKNETLEEIHWCSAKGCNACVEESCRITCKGFLCGTCPSGDCCNGKNCNACFNGYCCTSSTCNYCLRACRHASINETTCSRNCKNATRDVFVIALDPYQKEVMIYVKGIPYKGVVVSGKIMAANNTVTVFINGTEHLATILWPLFSVNNNSMSLNNSKKYKKKALKAKTESVMKFNTSTKTNIKKGANGTTLVSISNFIPEIRIVKPRNAVRSECDKRREDLYQKYYNHLQEGCCHVVHPLQCYYAYYPHFYPYCSRRTHEECSKLCTSKFIHFGPGLTLQQPTRCDYIQSFPYIYCGRYTILNCDSCYICKERYDPEYCPLQSICSPVCKETLVAPDLSRFVSEYPLQYKETWQNYPDQHYQEYYHNL